jgi:AraC family transcriptional regulator
VEAELGTAGAAARLVRYHFQGPLDVVYRLEGMYRMDLCLTSRHRSARANFRDRWRTDRFERIGNILLIPPGLDVHTRTDDSEALPFIVCDFDARYVEDLTRDRPLGDGELAATLDIRAGPVRTLMLRMAQEARQPGFAGDLCVELLTRQMVIELVRHFQSVSSASRRCGLAPWQLRRLDERLEALHAPTLDDLATICRLSVRQLSRSFRVSRGCSLGAYVAEAQVRHAKRLLAGDQSVTQIAEALGFASGSSFCSAFRRATGLSPGTFRRELLGA